MKKIIEYVKSFFYSQDKPQPVYFWATVFNILAVAVLILRISGEFGLTDTLIIGIFGYIAAWIGLYNIYKK